MKILIVEDDELVREMAVESLTDAGFEVVEAATAEEALARCEEHVADVLFTDIRLPGPMDGWRLGEEARKVKGDLAVIYASGFSHEAPRPVPRGVFLRKPYLPSQIVGVIERLVGDE